MADETQDNQSIRANDNSVAVGNVTVGGTIGGNLTIGNTGFNADQVSALISQISITFQPKPFDGRCPYKGLDVFDEEDAELFFGREKLLMILWSVSRNLDSIHHRSIREWEIISSARRTHPCLETGSYRRWG